jgi:hypothetical protein
VVGGAALVEFGAPGVTPRIVCGEHGQSPVSSSPTYSKTLLKDAGWRAPDALRREDPGRAQRWAVEMPQAKQIVYFRPFFDLSNPNLEKLIGASSSTVANQSGGAVSQKTRHPYYPLLVGGEYNTYC